MPCVWFFVCGSGSWSVIQIQSFDPVLGRIAPSQVSVCAELDLCPLCLGTTKWPWTRFGPKQVHALHEKVAPANLTLLENSVELVGLVLGRSEFGRPWISGMLPHSDHHFLSSSCMLHVCRSLTGQSILEWHWLVGGMYASPHSAVATADCDVGSYSWVRPAQHSPVPSPPGSDLSFLSHGC